MEGLIKVGDVIAFKNANDCLITCKLLNKYGFEYKICSVEKLILITGKEKNE